MAKITDAVLNKATAYSGNSGSLDLQYGGTSGYLPQIGKKGTDGKYYDEWISNAAYIKRNLIPIVMSYPKFMDFLPQKDMWKTSFKALMELHAESIDGLSSGLTVDFDQHPIGGAGQMQDEVTNVTRAVSNITFNYKEKAGKSIQKFLDYYIRLSIMDPDTKKPLVMQYMKDLSQIGGLYLPDMYTFTTMFIEPDISMTTVVDAWLCTNMMPASNGDRLGKRDIHSANEMLDLSIEFKSITMNNSSVLTLAEKLLSKLTVLNKVPNVDLVLPTDSINPDIAKLSSGFNG